jgi:hypothetical protein
MKELNFRYGFIYKTVKCFLDSINYLNLVELFKVIAVKLNNQPTNIERNKTFARIGIDIFICLKWFVIAVIWNQDIHCLVLTIVVWYFIATNVYTYFYNHIWTDDALNTESFTMDRIRSRFMNLLLALAFSTFCFGYLYQVVYPLDFNWSEQVPNFSYAIQYSLSNSLAANFEQVKPLSDFANKISNIQLLITFIFIAIILSKSIPQTTSKI